MPDTAHVEPAADDPAPPEVGLARLRSWCPNSGKPELGGEGDALNCPAAGIWRGL